MDLDGALQQLIDPNLVCVSCGTATLFKRLVVCDSCHQAFHLAQIHSGNASGMLCAMPLGGAHVALHSANAAATITTTVRGFERTSGLASNTDTPGVDAVPCP